MVAWDVTATLGKDSKIHLPNHKRPSAHAPVGHQDFRLGDVFQVVLCLGRGPRGGRVEPLTDGWCRFRFGCSPQIDPQPSFHICTLSHKTTRCSTVSIVEDSPVSPCQNKTHQRSRTRLKTSGPLSFFDRLDSLAVTFASTRHPSHPTRPVVCQTVGPVWSLFGPVLTLTALFPSLELLEVSHRQVPTPAVQAFHCI